MPYIKPEDRDVFSDTIADLPVIEGPGELNYLLTMVCQTYIGDNKLSYQTINDIIGALEACKQEFYRRIVVSYEEKKREESGDVY